MIMRKNLASEDATSLRPSREDDVARWIESRPLAGPYEAASEDMRDITAKYAQQLVAAFSKVTNIA